jgi:fumarate reductase flavoprotein subunit
LYQDGSRKDKTSFHREIKKDEAMVKENFSNLSADVVVIGGGGAGLAAAVASAEKGAKTLVVERRQNPGGNSAMTEGLFAVESPVQKRMNIDARRDYFFKLAMDRENWKLNPRIMRAFIDKSGDTIGWLENKGLTFECVRYYPNQSPLVFHCFKGGGTAYVKAMLDECSKLGIRFLKNTRAKRLITDKKTNVSGLIAASADKEIQISSKSVIIATGGYAGNKKLLKKYCPFNVEFVKCYGLPHTGDGLLMATEIGAANEGLGILHMGGPDFVGEKKLRALPWEPNMVWVNKNGERFADEAMHFLPFSGINAVMRQPDSTCYAIFDERIKQNMMNIGVIKGWGTRIPATTKLTYLDEELKKEAEKGSLMISESLVSIAGWIGAKSEILEAAISEYNDFCDNKYDAIFAKDPRYLEALRTPPYYALKCRLGFIQTIGGIKINQNMEVLDKNNTPVPGLFSAGSDAGGWETDTYNLEITGAALGFAVNSGRIAGDNAAKFSMGVNS